jgi:hypothetical protein
VGLPGKVVSVYIVLLDLTLKSRACGAHTGQEGVRLNPPPF